MDFFGTKKKKKKKRKDASAGQRVNIVLKQKGKCKKCGMSFFETGGSRPKFHHIDGDRSNKDESNFEALCPNCHDKEDEKLKSKKPKQG